MSQNYEVDVLLATYNGEKYIEDFLSSLLKQKNCKINLYVSDDGSTDSTIPLLLRYQDEFNEFRLMQGPELGPMLNFFNLLRASKGKYIALADQDDIWMENHLHASLQRISKFESPALTFSSVAQFMCCPSHSEIWPNQKNQLEFPNIFFENIGRGCTFVFNSSARDLVNGYEPKHAIMHDWWILLRLLIQGRVIFSPFPEIFYRIHENNHIGLGNSGLATTIRTLRLGKINTIQQLKELANIVFEENNPLQEFDIQNLLNRLNGRFVERLKLVISKDYRYRRKFIDDLKMRIIIVLLPIFDRNSRNAE